VRLRKIEPYGTNESRLSGVIVLFVAAPYPCGRQRGQTSSLYLSERTAVPSCVFARQVANNPGRCSYLHGVRVMLVSGFAQQRNLRSDLFATRSEAPRQQTAYLPGVMRLAHQVGLGPAVLSPEVESLTRAFAAHVSSVPTCEPHASPRLSVSSSRLRDSLSSAT
jgi:hypothetical protein